MGKMQITLLLFILIHRYMAQDSDSVQFSPPFTCTATTTTTSSCEPGETTQAKPRGYISPSVSQGRPGKSGAPGIKGSKGEKGDPCQCDVADEQVVNELREMLQVKEERYQELHQRMELLEEMNTKYPENCEQHEIFRKSLGKDPNNTMVTIYPFKSLGILTGQIINCSSQWKVVQRRKEGSVDFYRDWESYVNGFGDPDGEFWIGLSALHALTSSQTYTLRIKMIDWEEVEKYVEYSTFVVGNEESKFKLTIGGYSGTAGDSLASHNGMKFSSFDADNDIWGGNCAESYSGAWWFVNCHYSNLNGKYHPASSHTRDAKGVVWYHFHSTNYYSLKFVEMKIRPQ